MAQTPGLGFSPEEAIAHLREVDLRLAAVIDRTAAFDLVLRGDPYGSLLRAILFQQLAGAAASAIQRRFLALYSEDGRPPTPEELLATSDEELRAVGISRQKAEYMHDLALHVLEGRLDFAALPDASDDEVIKHLTAVKGLGEWSAHMFLMFHLGRPDVLPVGDLGVRLGMKRTYDLPETPTPKQAKEIGEPWAPFRSVGSWYMWRATDPNATDL